MIQYLMYFEEKIFTIIIFKYYHYYYNYCFVQTKQKWNFIQKLDI